MCWDRVIEAEQEMKQQSVTVPVSEPSLRLAEIAPELLLKLAVVEAAS